MRTKDDDTDENRAATFGTLRTMSLKASVSSRYFIDFPRGSSIEADYAFGKWNSGIASGPGRYVQRRRDDVA